MSDLDEDYMSDKLLVGCEQNDIRPGLLFNKSQKRQHELRRKQEERTLKRPKPYHEQEKEAREKGLSTAIASDNKGFKLLEKMGYKNGTGLGKSCSRITEPIAIKKTKNGTSGVGREKHFEEIFRKKISRKARALETTEQEFKFSHADRRNMMTLQKDYYRAQKICENLDLKDDIQYPKLLCFWTKQTRDILFKKKNEENEGTDESSIEEDDIITEELLLELIAYLREKYSYCMYCGDFVEENDGSSSCPGYTRKDHDE